MYGGLSFEYILKLCHFGIAVHKVCTQPLIKTQRERLMLNDYIWWMWQNQADWIQFRPTIPVKWVDPNGSQNQVTAQLIFFYTSNWQYSYKAAFTCIFFLLLVTHLHPESTWGHVWCHFCCHDVCSVPYPRLNLLLCMKGQRGELSLLLGFPSRYLRGQGAPRTELNDQI